RASGRSSVTVATAPFNSSLRVAYMVITPCFYVELRCRMLYSSTFQKTRLGNASMAVERTFSIIKPDAVAKNAIGQILSRFEGAGLKIIAARMLHLSRAQAEGFYAVHRERPFFKDLVEFMISGPVLLQVLQGENAIARNRELMGATDPKKAAKG